MDHTPQSSGQDERPLRILERAPVPEPHRERLFALVRAAQEAAHAAGSELQCEFGKEHVALIVGCNQFIRLFRGGPQPGAVELLLDAQPKTDLAAAGFDLGDPDGMVFKLFGWVRVDPMQGEGMGLVAATRSAFDKARRAKQPAGPASR